MPYWFSLLIMSKEENGQLWGPAPTASLIVMSSLLKPELFPLYLTRIDGQLNQAISTVSKTINTDLSFESAVLIVEFCTKLWND